MSIPGREPRDKAETLRRARVISAHQRYEFLEQVAEQVHAILADGLDPDGALTLSGAVIEAWRALRPAIDEIVDGGR